jgi:hypothetical protein
MLVSTEAMYREERLQKMWCILDLLRPEGNVLLVEEKQGICWVAPKEEVERDNFTDRSTYGEWGLPVTLWSSILREPK